MITQYQSKLFIVFNRSMSRARKQEQYPVDKLLERIKKAFSILQSLDYYQAERQEYRPTTATCNCKDWEFHLAHKRAYAGPCKHMIAETLLLRIQEIKYIQSNFFDLCGGVK